MAKQPTERWAKVIRSVKPRNKVYPAGHEFKEGTKPFEELEAEANAGTGAVEIYEKAVKGAKVAPQAAPTPPSKPAAKSTATDEDEKRK